MKEIECEGKTVTIAVESGLKDIGLRRDQVEVQVLDEGSAGILGFGAKPARVLIREKRWGDAPAPVNPPPSKPSASRPRLSSARPVKQPRPSQRASAPPPAKAPEPKPAPRPEPRPEPRRETARPEPRREHRAAPIRAERRPAREERPAFRPRREAERAPHSPEEGAKAAEAAALVLSEIMKLAGLADAKVDARWDAAQDRVQAELASADASVVIGKGGRTLEALQFLTTIIVGRRTGAPAAIQVECEGWWKNIEQKLAADADRAALEVAESGHPFRFEPMDASMRRLIHRRLADHAEVETASEGEGSWRKVVVRPKRKA